MKKGLLQGYHDYDRGWLYGLAGALFLWSNFSPAAATFKRRKGGWGLSARGGEGRGCFGGPFTGEKTMRIILI